MKYRSRLNINSGVYPVPLFTKEYPCGGNCVFCPTESGFPKSYVKNEDTLFAKKCSYSPRRQFSRFINRLPSELRSKSLPIEIIILGGSFSSLDRDYRREFFSELYSFMSNMSKKETNRFTNSSWENGQYRPSVVTVESRPDQIDASECKFLRDIGVSKVELGVQHTSDTVLRTNMRGHDQEAVIQATRVLKDGGFKVGYHVMLGLPSATFEDDRVMLEETLWRSEYSPDYLKIYPCVLLRNPELQPALHDLYQSGKWIPISESNLVLLLKSLSKIIPSYVRLSRIQRQFDQRIIFSGVKSGIRARSGIEFFEIRSREVGRLCPATRLESLGQVKERITRNGNDIFIEFFCGESILLGLGRIRVRNAAKIIIRELRIFGEAAPIGYQGLIQGTGLGTKLLSRIEAISTELGACRILVNAALGARPFFRKKGYTDTESGFLSKVPIGAKYHANPSLQFDYLFCGHPATVSNR